MKILPLLGLVMLAIRTSAAQLPDGMPNGAPIPHRGISPDACVWAPRLTDYLRTVGHPDSVVYLPPRDTMSQDAVLAVTHCVRGYEGLPVQPWQRLSVARSQLVLGKDAEARAMTDAYLAAMNDAPVERRAWALMLVVRSYAGAHPPRLTEARLALQTLDALGAAAIRARVMAHMAMAGTAARLLDDTTAEREANAAITVGRASQGKIREILAGDFLEAFKQKAEIALRHQNGTVARAILDSGFALIDRHSRTGQDLQGQRQMYAVVGQPAAPIEAQYWFHRTGSGTKPARGVVTVLSSTDPSCSTMCETVYPGLQRLAARFAGRPVEIITMTETLGFFQDSSPIAPVREAALDSGYFYGFAKVPGALAVYATAYTFGMDDRRMTSPSPQAQHYPGAEFVVVDSQGIIRYVGDRFWVGKKLEEPLVQFISGVIDSK